MRVEAATTPSDHRELAALADVIWRECYADLLPAGQINLMLARNYDLARLGAEQQAGTVFRLARADNCRALGYSSLSPDPRDETLYWLDKLYVHVDVRGTGLGRRLFEQAVFDTHNAGSGRLRLRVNRGNTRAIAAYRRLGLSIEGRDNKPIGQGYVMDDYIMGMDVTALSVKGCQ